MVQCRRCGETVTRHQVMRTRSGTREVVVQWAVCAHCRDATVESFTVRPVTTTGTTSRSSPRRAT